VPPCLPFPLLPVLGRRPVASLHQAEPNGSVCSTTTHPTLTAGIHTQLEVPRRGHPTSLSVRTDRPHACLSTQVLEEDLNVVCVDGPILLNSRPMVRSKSTPALSPSSRTSLDDGLHLPHACSAR
jgi:hypothetical protein